MREKNPACLILGQKEDGNGKVKLNYVFWCKKPLLNTGEPQERNTLKNDDPIKISKMIVLKAHTVLIHI